MASLQQQYKHPLWLLPRGLHLFKTKCEEKKSVTEIWGIPVEPYFGSQWEEVSLALRRGVWPSVVSHRVSAPVPLYLFPSIFKEWPPMSHLPLPTSSELLLLVLPLPALELIFFQAWKFVFPKLREYEPGSSHALRTVFCTSDFWGISNAFGDVKRFTSRALQKKPNIVTGKYYLPFLANRLKSVHCALPFWAREGWRERRESGISYSFTDFCPDCF